MASISLSNAAAKLLKPTPTTASITLPHPMTGKTPLHPWLLSTSSPRKPVPNLWQALKSNQILSTGTARAQKHLPGYDFPADFIRTITPTVTHRLFPALEGREPAGTVLTPLLREIFTRAIDGYAIGYTPTSPAVERIIPTRVHLQYGPNPIPATGYTLQEWLGFMTLVIPYVCMYIALA